MPSKIPYDIETYCYEIDEIYKVEHMHIIIWSKDYSNFTIEQIFMTRPHYLPFVYKGMPLKIISN